MSFGENLKNIRRHKNITQEELAEILGVSRQAVSKWESNNGYPETDKLLIISKTLDVSVDYLLKDASIIKDNTEKIISQSSKQQEAESVKVSGKLYIIDANKRKLAVYEEFTIDRIGWNNNGEATVIGGIKSNTEKVKVPVAILYGITKGVMGLNKKTVLGYYASLDDAQKELSAISMASKTDTSYELKYAAIMQGVRIVEANK